MMLKTNNGVRARKALKPADSKNNEQNLGLLQDLLPSLLLMPLSSELLVPQGPAGVKGGRDTFQTLTEN